jgi:hypothetical protein
MEYETEGFLRVGCQFVMNYTQLDPSSVLLSKLLTIFSGESIYADVSGSRVLDALHL